MPFDIKAFYKENKQPQTQAQFVVSEKFVDPKTGKPIPWTIREISAEEDQALKDKYTEITTDRRTGVRNEYFDQNNYIIGIATLGVVEPELDDRGLLESYNVKRPDKLLQRMLSAGQIQKLALKVIELSGLDDIDTNSEFDLEYAEAKKN